MAWLSILPGKNRLGSARPWRWPPRVAGDNDQQHCRQEALLEFVPALQLQRCLSPTHRGFLANNPTAWVRGLRRGVWVSENVIWRKTGFREEPFSAAR